MNEKLMIQSTQIIGEKLAYEKPTLRRVELAIDETLSSGCKLGSDSVCVGPPTTAYEGGS